MNRFRTLIAAILILSMTMVVPAMAQENQSRPIQIWVSSIADQQDYEQMIEKYRETVDPNFEAEVHNIGFMEMTTKLTVAMETGIDTPDIVQLDENLFGSFLGFGPVPFVDLTERAKESGVFENIAAPRLSLFTYQDRLYGIPQSLSAVMLFYRVDRFEELGISPEDIDTWEKLIEVGHYVRQAGKPWEHITVFDFSTFPILLRQRGGDIVDKDGNPTLTTPLAIDTGEFMQRLLDEEVASYTPRGSIHEDSFLGTGAIEDTLTLIAPEWYGMDLMKGLLPDMAGQWRAMPLPRWTDDMSSDSRTSSFGGQGLLIYAGSQHIDESWDFINFVLNSPEGAVERFVNDNAFPAYMPVWDDPRLLKPDPYFNDQPIGALLLELAPELPTQNQSFNNAFFLWQWDSIWKAVNSRTATVVEALQAAEQALSQPMF